MELPSWTMPAGASCRELVPGLAERQTEWQTNQTLNVRAASHHSPKTGAKMRPVRSYLHVKMCVSVNRATTAHVIHSHCCLTLQMSVHRDSEAHH